MIPSKTGTNPRTIFFPKSEKVGYMMGKHVLIFKATSIDVERSIEFPFHVLFFSLPFNEHYMLVVNEESPEELILWDMEGNKYESSLLFEEPIIKFLSSDTFAAIITKKEVAVVKGFPLLIQYKFETPLVGNFDLVQCHDDQNHCILAFSDPEQKDSAIIQKIPGSFSPNIIRSHDDSLLAISLSFDGKLLATTSEKGTIVRVFSTDTGSIIMESRRGWNSAKVHFISFSPDSKYICTLSNFSTVHIFRVDHDKSTIYQYVLPKADITLDLTSSAPYSCYVLNGGKILFVVSSTGNCFLYNINRNDHKPTLRTKLMIPAIAQSITSKESPLKIVDDLETSFVIVSY